MKKILLLMVLCVSMITARAATVYVDVAATGSGNGTSWADAYTTIDAALEDATIASGDNIWVKAGVYEITTQLLIKDGVSVYGGFTGTESSIDDRAKSDLDGNGTIDPWEYSNASIIKATATFNYMIDGTATTKTVLDGFTFTNHTGAQSVAYVKNKLEIQRCIFTGNNLEGSSSGYTIYGILYAMDGAVVSECLLENNTVNAINKPVYGAIVALRNAGSTLKNSVIRNNKVTANGQQIRGVAMYINNGGIAYNNLIYNNSGVQGSSAAAQGAVYLDNGGGVNYFINNTVVNNFSETGNSIRQNNTNAYVINSVLAESGTANTGGTGAIGLHYYNCAFSATTTHANVKDAVVLSSLASAGFNLATDFVGVATNETDSLKVQKANWNLLGASELIDKATDTVSYFATIDYNTDILNNPRNIVGYHTQKWDIGAYELQKTAETITWSQDLSADIDFPGANIPLTATTSDGGTVEYSVDDAFVAAIENGNELKPVGLGTTTIRANYFTAEKYASEVTKSITITSQYTPSIVLSTSNVNIATTEGSTGSVDVTTNFRFTIVSESLPTWLTASPMSGNDASDGSAANLVSVTFTATANPTAFTRSASVQVESGGQLEIVTVEQAAGAASFSLSKNDANLTYLGKRADGKNDTVLVTSNTTWTIDKGSATWLTVTPMSGSGDADGEVVTPVVISADIQTYPSSIRNATLTFTATNYGSQPTVTVEQAAAPAPVKIFVDAAQADDSGDGLTWTTAKKTVQAAVDIAAANRDTVFVKAGTYIISSTLVPAEGVNVYGGFAGTENDLSERIQMNAVGAPWDFVNATILDANNTAIRILNSSALGTVTRWDGFTFQNVKDGPSAGGAAVVAGNLMLYNCIFKNNSVGPDPTISVNGGAAVVHSTGGIYNSLFEGNYASGSGSAIYINGGTISGMHNPISGCHFIKNHANATNNVNQNGGTIASYYGSGTGIIKVSNSYVADNTTTGMGAGFFVNLNTGAARSAFLLIEDCVITGNTASVASAVKSNNGTIINRCLITNNKSTTGTRGGTIHLGQEQDAVYNSIIANNAETGSGQSTVFINAANISIVGNTVVNNNSAAITGNAAAISSKVTNTIVQGNTEDVINVTSGATIADPIPGENNITSGVTFLNPTIFKGIATSPENLRAINLADWRPAAATTAGANLTSRTGEFNEGSLLLTDAYSLARPASGDWTVGAYNYASSLTPNTITWSQDLSLDMNGVGSPKELVLNATATASGSVQYTVDNEQVAYIASGNVLKSFAPGTTTVRAIHSGDATHGVATEVAKEVVVSGDPSTLTLSSETLNVAKTANSDGTITLSSNYGYVLTYKALWLTVDPAAINEPSTDRLITFTTTANPSIEERVDSVVFLSGGLSKKLVVIQAAGDPTLNVSPATVTLSALEGASNTFAITSNTSWNIEGKPSWVSLSATSGTGDATITATVTEENTNESASRTATLTLSANGVADITLTLEQSRALPATIIYVAQDGSGVDGTSWATAYNNIADALVASTSGNKIYVKAGTYAISDALRSKAGVRVYGGFDGTESSDVARAKGSNSWDFTNATILEPIAGVRVIDSTTLEMPATWDGFTMQGARHFTTKEDSARVGGVAYLKKNTFLNNCIIRDNITVANGGGVYMDVNARVYNSLIERNVSTVNSGGGVFMAPVADDGNYTPLVGNSIIDNKASQGGGLNLVFGVGTFAGTATIFNNTFARDTAYILNGGGGGVMYNVNAVCTIITDSCTFDSNIKSTEHESGGSPGGGGIRTQGDGGTVIFNRCVFTNNRTVDNRGGSALHTNNNTHKMRIYNTLVMGNHGGAEAIQLRGAHIINSTVLGNGGNGVGFANGVILNNVVWGNGADLNPATADASNFAQVVFVDSTAGNFRLALGETAVDKGVAIEYQTEPLGVEMLKTDFAGTPRPQGASFDPGMYEYIKVRPTATITWSDDLSNLDITNTEFIKLTAQVSGASAEESPYLSPVAYISGDDLTVDTQNDTLILMGTGTTTLIAHTNINPFYDTVAVVKTVTVSGSNYLAVTPRNIPLGMAVVDSAASFKLNTDNSWTISGIPAWITLTDVSGSAGRAEIWINIIDDNSLSAPRNATLTVAAGSKTQTINVSQDGLLFSISTTEINLAALGDVQDFMVYANLVWMAEADVDWLTISPAFGTQTTNVFVAPKDNEGEPRTATITIQADRSGVAPLTIAVAQAGTSTPPTSAGKERVTAFIYPNPTSGMLNIALTEELNGATLQIYNLMGTLLYSQPWSGQKQSIDISSLNSGTLVLVLRTKDGRTISTKISKQ